MDQAQEKNQLIQSNSDNKKQNQLPGTIEINDKHSNSNTQNEKIKTKLKQASDLFHNSQYQQALQILNNILQKQLQAESNEQNSKQTKNVRIGKTIVVLINRASLYIAIVRYQQALADCQKSITLIAEIDKQAAEFKNENTLKVYCIKTNCLIKLNREKQARQFAEEALKQFPEHKKLRDLAKLAKQKTIAEDQQTFMDHMFEKLCLHPQVREYLKDQAFLTKVQRMIRNPSLTPVLQKMDPRIKEASEALMMADEDWS